MKRFKAKIVKVGINPCVAVPKRITEKMTASKGYIRIKGKIDNHSFTQTLVPVKGQGYRLYVNGPMLKGSGRKTGDTATFVIGQNHDRKDTIVPMRKEFKSALIKARMLEEFLRLSPSRKKDILRYLNSLKTESALQRNIEKLIRGLKKIEPAPLFRL